MPKWGNSFIKMAFMGGEYGLMFPKTSRGGKYPLR